MSEKVHSRKGNSPNSLLRSKIKFEVVAGGSAKSGSGGHRICHPLTNLSQRTLRKMRWRSLKFKSVLIETDAGALLKRVADCLFSRKFQ